jgi:hypothetical protein
MKNLFFLIALELSCSGCRGPAHGDLAGLQGRNTDDVTFTGTVTSVEIANLEHPYLKWVVTLAVDEVRSGASPGKSLWFAIHSPTLEGAEVGGRYLITAKKNTGGGYDVISHDRLRKAPADHGPNDRDAGAEESPITNHNSSRAPGVR